MAHYAEDDPWVSQAARKNMERALTRAKCSYVAYDYPSTQHWFAERDRSKEFNAPAARLAFERTVSHIASR
jgi:dienelactone hydrolase